MSQVAFPSGDSIECNLPQNLQGQLLFRGSGFFIVAPSASSTQGDPALTGSTSEPEQQQQQQQQQQQEGIFDSSTHLARPNKASTVAADSTASTEPLWQVVYVLADEDLPELARQGLWYAVDALHTWHTIFVAYVARSHQLCCVQVTVIYI